MVDLVQGIFLIALGATVGLAVGFTGIGGAVLMTPSLIILFGFSAIVAIAIDIPYAATTKTVAVFQHARQDNLRKDVAKYFIIGGLPGITTGIIVLLTLRTFIEPEAVNRGLNIVIGAILVCVATATIVQVYKSYKEEIMLQKQHLDPPLADKSPTQPLNSENVSDHAQYPPAPCYETQGNADSALQMKNSCKMLAIGLGALIGAVVGFTSIGSGTLITVSLIVVFRMQGRHLVGTDLLIAWAMLTLGATIYFLSEWTRDFEFYIPVILLLLLGSIPGTYLGSKLTNYASDSMLKGTIAILIWITGIVMILQGFSLF
ncbi:MAG: sulfite exporter TauE/SafE family protein [Candidatus Heimdallarchaeota archaeon]